MRNGFISKMAYFPSNWVPLGMGEGTGKGHLFVYLFAHLFIYLFSHPFPNCISVLSLSRIMYIFGIVLIHSLLPLTAPHVAGGKNKSCFLWPQDVIRAQRPVRVLF